MSVNAYTPTKISGNTTNIAMNATYGHAHVLRLYIVVQGPPGHAGNAHQLVAAHPPQQVDAVDALVHQRAAVAGPFAPPVRLFIVGPVPAPADRHRPVGEPAEAEKYRSELLAAFPNSSYTEIIRDPNFFTKARYGKQIEDSLYAEAYDAFRKNDFETLNRNCEKSDAEYRDGANRNKFIFLEAMSALHDGNMQTFTIRLDSVSRYKDDPIGEIATKILEGIKSGRKPIGGQYNMKDFWESRKMLFDNGDEASKADTLNDNRLEPFTFILTFSPDSVEEGKLLYNISKFNFTTFAIRNFNVSVAHADTIHQIIIEGFANFDEVHRYAMELYQDSASKTMLKHTDPVIISDHNLKLVNEKYTLQEYQIFYNQHFVPIHVRKDLDLDIDPGKFIWDEFEEVKPKETEKTDDDEIEIIDDSSEWY